MKATLYLYGVIISIALLVFAMGAQGAVINDRVYLRNQNDQSKVMRLVNNQLVHTDVNDPGVGYRVLGTTDIDRDGTPDLLFQNMTQGVYGDVNVWDTFLPGTTYTMRQVKSVWDMQIIADIDGDGCDDLVWRYMLPGSNDTGVSYIWFTDCRNVTKVRKRGGAPLTWQLIGAKDINGDGAADMIYISPDNQIRVLMATPGRTCANVGAGFIPSGYSVLGLADYSGMARGDILVRNTLTGEVLIYSLNATGIILPPYTGVPDDPNASCTSSNLLITPVVRSIGSIGASWQHYASADLNSDGVTDIVWLLPDGSLTVWLMNTNFQPTIITNAGSSPAGYGAIVPYLKRCTTSEGDVMLKNLSPTNMAIASAMILNGCGGGGGSSTPTVPPTPTAPTITVTANPITGLLGVNDAITATFTITGGTPTAGSYSSHTATAKCGGNDVLATTTQLSAGITSGTISMRPQTSWPGNSTCSFTFTANASPSGSASASSTATTASPFPSFTKLVASGVSSVVLIDVATSAIQTTAVDSVACTGVAYKPQTGKVRIYCSIANTGGKYFWDVDPITGAATALTNPISGFDGVTKALVAIGRNGREYYIVGTPQATGGSTARVVVMDNSTKVAEIPLSVNATKADYILRIWLDETSGKLWLGSRGGVLDRIDLATLKTDLSITSIDASVSQLEDMEVTSGHVVVSVHRTATGADALVFDKNTGAKVKEIAFPVAGSTGNSLSFGITLTTSDLLIATSGGYYRVDPVTFAVRNFASLFVVGFTSVDLITVNNVVYGVGGNNNNDIISIPSSLSSLTKMTTLAGASRITYINN